MSGIPFTAGSEASGGWPKHRGPRPPFKPGPADAKAARKAEKRAEKERQKQAAEPSLTSRVMSSVKSSFLGRLHASSPEQPDEKKKKKKTVEEEEEKYERAQRNRDGIPIIEITPAEGKGT